MRAAGRSFLDSIAQAATLGEQGKLDIAWKLLAPRLIENPNDIRALVTGAYVMRRLGALPQAYHFAAAAIKGAPRDAGAWTNFGHVCADMWLVDEAEAAYEQGLRVATTADHKDTLRINLSALYIDNGRYAEAEAIVREILERRPDHKNAQANLGFCQLARRDWTGWARYRLTIGSDWRKRVQYRDEPEWDGTPGKTVVLYGEQGLGDELSFASMLPDALDVCRKVILDVDHRLVGLLERSFPAATVYGTKTAREGQPPWDRADWEFDASLPLGQIGEYFRTTDAAFPDQPYLKACPDRLKMWKGLFGDKPTIGIAWSGGIPKTGVRDRSTTLRDWLPLFESVDARFVSLQYRSSAAEIAAFRAEHDVDLVEYPFGTLTQDYDDTAAMVAAMDCIIGVPTSVIHLGGALGVKTFAMRAKSNCWNYAAGLPFQPVTFVEFNDSWRETIKSAVPQIAKHCGCSSDTTRDSRLPSASLPPPSFNTQRSRFLSAP